MQCKWMQIFWLCAAIQFQFIAGQNNSGSQPMRHICTRLTEHNDCVFRYVHFKKDQPSVFGMQFNPQQYLAFQHSTLEYLPKSLVDSFPNVVLLNLNNLKIASIEPNAFEQAVNLQTVYLEGNRLTKIDRDAFRGTNELQVLVLSKNEIASIDSLTFSSNTGLQYLLLDQNRLDVLPSFTNTAQLQCLNASHNNLASIDDGHFHQLRYLHTLDLSFNRLRRLNLQQLNAHLELVDVSFNNLTDFVMPTNVKILNARNNSLREFAVGQQCTLRKVDLSRNKLETQPTFENCGSLEHLDLSHNLLEEFVYKASMDKLQTINLAHNNLFEIQLPNIIKTFKPSLKRLDLSHNQLTHIDSLDAFKKLEWLYLNNNKLITFNKVFTSNLNAIQGFRMANNEWNCNDINYFAYKTQDKHYNQCATGQMNRNGICCRAYSKPHHDRLNEILREADFYKRASQKNCPKPESATAYLDEIRNAMNNADTGRTSKMKEIANVVTQQTYLKAALQDFQNKQIRLTTSKVNLAREIENQRKSHRVIKQGLISDKEILERIIKFVQERDAFNKDQLYRRKKDTEESKGLFNEKQHDVDELKQNIEALKNTLTSFKQEEKKKKREKDLLEKKVNKIAASINGGSGTIS